MRKTIIGGSAELSSSLLPLLAEKKNHTQTPSCLIPSVPVPNVSVEKKEETKKIDKKCTVFSENVRSLYLNNDFIQPKNNNSDINYVKTMKIQFFKYEEEYTKDPNNILSKCTLAKNSIVIAYIFKELIESAKLTVSFEKLSYWGKKKDELFLNASILYQAAKNLDGLHAMPYHIESMLMEWEGVDCKNLTRVEKYVRLLLTAQALDPASAEINKTLDEIVALLQGRWAELGNTEAIEQLGSWRNEDPLKALFIANPKLFTLSGNQKYSAFFASHPELKNFQAFHKKYPDVGTIGLSELTLECLRDTLEKNKDNPLAIKLPLISTQPILNADFAKEIRNHMLSYFGKEKNLKIYLGNSEDVKAIAQSFADRTLLIPERGSLNQEKMEMAGYTDSIYTVSISEPYFLKKS